MRPDGQRRKADFDRASQFLDDASAAMMVEIVGRFDPTAGDGNRPRGLSYAAVMQMLTSWRENAWRSAEAVVNASSPSVRGLVAATIESEAADIVANSVLLTQSYTSPLISTATRDACCALHGGDAAPLAYPFGMPTPYGG